MPRFAYARLSAALFTIWFAAAAHPQTACERARLIDSQIDRVLADIRAEVAKIEQARQRKEALDKQLAEVRAAEQKREAQLLADYDTEIRRLRDEIRLQTEMIGWLSAAGWNSFMRRYARHFDAANHAAKAKLARQQAVRARYHKRLQTKIRGLDSAIKDLGSKITNLDTQVQKAQETAERHATSYDKAKQAYLKNPNPGNCRNRDQWRTTFENSQRRLEAVRTEVQPKKAALEGEIQTLQNQRTALENLAAQNEQAMTALRGLLESASRGGDPKEVVEWLGQYGELRDLGDKDASTASDWQVAQTVLTEAEIEQIKRDEEKRIADAIAGEYVLGADPNVLRSGDWNAILAEYDPLKKVEILMARREQFETMLRDTEALRRERRRELAAEFESFQRERDRLTEALTNATRDLDNAETVRTRKVAALNALYPRLWEAQAACRKEKHEIAERGRIITAVRTTHKKAGATTAAAARLSLSGGGSFEAKPVDKPCDPPILLGSIEVPSGGRLEAHIVGTPPVPATWSLYNTNSSLSVSFEPELGMGYGRAINLLSLSGQAQDSDLSGTATWSGPGRISAIVGAPRGSGPLSGGCFGQGFSASVKVVEINNADPAFAGDTLGEGDQLMTDGSGQALIAVPGGGQVSVLRGTTVKVIESTPDKFRLRFEDAQYGNGLRFVSEPGHRVRLELETGPYVLVPEGTDFTCEADRGTTVIRVLDGGVRVSTGTETGMFVPAGKQLLLPAWTMEDLKAADPGRYDSAGLAPGTILFDDTTTQPYGETVWSIEGTTPTAGWVFEDPGHDTRLDAVDTQTLIVTVPDGNEMHRNWQGAPRLLHKVTGDFDLEALHDLATSATHYASAEFVAYSPGSHIGVLAEQTDMNTLGAHYRSLGPFWYVGRGLRKLPLAGRELKDCPDAPDGAIRIRLSRRGDLWRTYWSLDGENWNLASRVHMPLPETAWAGLLFKRVADDRLRSEPATHAVSALRLRSAPLFSLPSPDWDLLQDGGAAVAEGQSVTLRLDGSKPATVRAQMGEPLAGDFDLVVRFAQEPWNHQPGESRYAVLILTDGTDQNMLYLGQEKRDSIARRLATDLRHKGAWSRFTATDYAQDRGWWRVARTGGEMRSWHWLDGEWVPVAQRYDAPLSGPVYLTFEASTAPEARTSAVLETRFHIEHLAQEATTAGLEWKPSEPTLLRPVDVPTSVCVTAAADLRLFEAPFALGRIFCSPAGDVYLFSSQRDKQKLVRLAADGTASTAATTDGLAGVNRKAGVVMPDGRIVFTVDFWYEGGNRLGGLYALEDSATYSDLNIEPRQGGLTDVILAPDGGFYLSDFENDSIWHWPRGGGPALKRLDLKELPGGLVAMAWDASRQIIWGLNISDYPGSGQAGVYAISPSDGSVRLAAKPDEGKQWAGLAFGGGTAFGDAIFVTEPTSGTVWRVTPDGIATPFIMGLGSAADIAINPATGEMLVVCGDSRQVLAVKPLPGAFAESNNTAQAPDKIAVRPTPTPGPASTAATTKPTADDLLVTRQSPDTMAGGKAGPALDATPAPPSVRATPSQEPTGSVYRLATKTDSHLLGVGYGRTNFYADMTITCQRPGSVLDTVGLNAAPPGSFALHITGEGKVQFQVYDPSARSAGRLENGWHVLTSKTRFAAGATHRVTATFDNGTCTLFVDGQREGSLVVPTRLSGQPVYLGDFPGDQHWGPKFNINQSLVGTVVVHHFGRTPVAE
ncbi:MAG: hypothetical protein N2111_10130 [Candidatus Sumerlaeaceae bacterium]|nr:hypothetical protein [Candidatus Sumerlaeaceae bacterium]